MTLKKISYSGIKQFCNCRRGYQYNYIDKLVPKKEAHALTFGSAWHEVLAAYYCSDIAFPLALHDDLKIEAMMEGYRKQYKWTDHSKVLGVELPFEIMIRPPNGGRAMRGVRFRGQIDLVVKRDDGIWIMEHKTAGAINGDTIAKLWHDLQIMLYAYAYQEMTGEKVKGIIYNVVQKTKIKQGAGETEAEFNARLTDLIAKSKTGKSSAKRKMPETDEEFQARLSAIYANPAMYHREEILCDSKRLKEVQGELWSIAKEIMSTKNYYKNRAQCSNYGTCQYFPICESGGNPIVIDNFYKEKEERK